MKALEEMIAGCEKIARNLEPGQMARATLRNKIMKITDDFLNQLEKAPAYVGPENYSLHSLNADFDGEQNDSFLYNIKNEVDVPGINPASGNHLGYVPGGGLYASALADYWASVTNRYAGIFFAGPGAVKIENELLRWMIRLVGYSGSAWGNLASGGSIANLTAIISAREEHGITPENVRKSVIYLTQQTHHCVTRALKIAGLHHAIIRYVEMDKNLKMDPEILMKLVAYDFESGNLPFLVVSSAGTTDAGIIDPIEKIDKVAKKYKLWHHVDAAYGGFFLLAKSVSKKLKGMQHADSIVMDPHKSLFLPYGLGVVLTKNGKHLINAFSYEASYMQDALEDIDEISPADVSPELTKHFRGLRMWLPLKFHGIKPFRASLEEKYYLAKYFFREIQKIQGFQVFQEPELTIVMFRYISPHIDTNRFNLNLVGEIHKDGRIFLSSTTLNGEVWLRVAILVFRTHRSAVDLLLKILKEKVEVLNN